MMLTVSYPDMDHKRIYNNVVQKEVNATITLISEFNETFGEDGIHVVVKVEPEPSTTH